MASKITVDFNANVTRFSSALDKATNDLNKFQSNASRMSGNLGRIISRNFGSLGVGLSVAGLTAFIKSSIDAADQLHDLAQKTGTSVEALAGLKLAADQNGTSLESVAFAAKKLGVNLVDKPDIFRKFGITARDTTGAMVQMADIFAAMPDGVEKSTLAVKVFGKGGEEMIPFLNQGSVALQELIDKGQRYNKITAESAAAADRFNDQLAELKANSAGVGTAIANDLLGPLNEMLGQLIEGKKIFGGFWAAVVGAGTMNPFKTWSESAKDLRKEISGLEEDKKRFTKYGSDTSSIDTGIAALNKKLEFAKYNQRQEALSDQGSIDAGREGRSLGRPGAADGKKGNALLRALGDPDAEKKRAQEAEKYLEELARIKTAKNERALAEFHKEAEKLKDQRAAWIDLIDPVEKYRKQLEEIDRLELVPGGLTKDQATEARFKVNQQIDELNNLKGADSPARDWETGAKTAIKKYIDDITNAAAQTEELLSKAFRGAEDALVKFVRTGKLDFRSLANSIIEDLIRIQIRKAIAGVFGGSEEKSGGGGAEIFASIGKIFGFADGGMHGGGLRIVGERGPELEATGPARIFNANQTRDILSGAGGGGNVSVMVNVDASGSSVEGEGDQSKQLGDMIGNAVRGVLVQEKRPGGLLA